MRSRGRGRPPHPDILTPREWEVLGLIDEGLTNEQIANRLGISPDGAKFHVAQILAKLGVSSRREAAAVAYANRGQLVRRWAFFPFLGKLTGGKTATTVGAGGLVAAAVVALIALFFALRGQSAQPFDMYPGLYVLDIDSGKVERRVDLRGAQTAHYEWSNDGEHFIVHRRDVPTDQEHLQVYDAESGYLEAEDNLSAQSLEFQKLQDGRLGVTFSRGDDGAPNPSSLRILAVLDSMTLGVLSQRRLEGQTYLVEWAPDGRTAAVSGDIAHGHVSMDGSDEDDRASFARWSPDGALYAKLAGQQNELYVEIRQTGANAIVARLDMPFLFGQGALQWSPDSRWLAVIDQDRLLVAGVDGSLPARTLVSGLPFSPQGGRSLAWPAWSPDSKSIAFISAEGELWLVDVQSGSTRKLYSAELPLPIEPRWSADGTKIAFRVEHSPGIFAVNADGSDSQYVVIGSRPDLARDGSRLTFAYGGDYYVISSKGTRLLPVTDYRKNPRPISDAEWRTTICSGGVIPPPHGSPDRPPSWSPDGSEVAIVDASLNLVRRSIRRPGDETSINDKAFSLSWSPDGSRSAYVDFISDGACDVVMLDEDGRELGRYPGSRYEWLGDNALIVTDFKLTDARTMLSLIELSLVDGSGSLVRGFEGAATVSPQLDVAVVGSATNLLTDLINVATGRSIRSLTLPSFGARFSPDGKYVVLEFYLRGSELVEVATGRTVRKMDQGGITSFSPDSRSAVLTDGAGNLSLLDMSQPDGAPQFIRNTGSIREMAWSPESTHLAFTYGRGSPKELVILERSTMKQVEIAAANASSIQWFPDGKRLLYQGDVDP